MQPVPADGETMGEVMFRGNVVMKGYLKKPKATQAAFAGGWFHSGDLGVKHPDGYIQLKDRSKDIIISGGENISSIEVEDALYRHPAIAAAAVVARPDEKWGETPLAVIELKPGASVTVEELIAHCRANLAGYKCPGISCSRRFQDLHGQDPKVQAAGDGEGPLISQCSIFYAASMLQVRGGLHSAHLPARWRGFEDSTESHSGSPRFIFKKPNPQP